MPKKTIFSNDDAVLWYYPEEGIVHHQVKRYIYGEALRNLLDSGYAELKANGGTKWLSDDRANSALGPEDSEWAENDWFPRVQAAGWKFWAIVLPQNVIGQMNMRRFIEHYAEAGMTAQVFSDPGEALDWLRAA